MQNVKYDGKTYNVYDYGYMFSEAKEMELQLARLRDIVQDSYYANQKTKVLSEMVTLKILLQNIGVEIYNDDPNDERRWFIHGYASPKRDQNCLLQSLDYEYLYIRNFDNTEYKILELKGTSIHIYNDSIIAGKDDEPEESFIS